MRREQFFKPENQGGTKLEEPAGKPAAEALADWEITRNRHLEAKNTFRESRKVLTGEEKYQAKKAKKYIKP